VQNWQIIIKILISRNPTDFSQHLGKNRLMDAVYQRIMQSFALEHDQYQQLTKHLPPLLQSRLVAAGSFGVGEGHSFLRGLTRAEYKHWQHIRQVFTEIHGTKPLFDGEIWYNPWDQSKHNLLGPELFGAWHLQRLGTAYLREEYFYRKKWGVPEVAQEHRLTWRKVSEQYPKFMAFTLPHIKVYDGYLDDFQTVVDYIKQRQEPLELPAPLTWDVVDRVASLEDDQISAHQEHAPLANAAGASFYVPPAGTLLDFHYRPRTKVLKRYLQAYPNEAFDANPNDQHLAWHMLKNDFDARVTDPRIQYMLTTMPYGWWRITHRASKENGGPLLELAITKGHIQTEFIIDRGVKLELYREVLPMYRATFQGGIESPVAFANQANDLMPYLLYPTDDNELDHSVIAEARAIANFSANVYSYYGLLGAAFFHQAIEEWVRAEELLQAVHDRYDDPWPLVKFRAKRRYAAANGEGLYQRALTKYY
jgi:hypothetical protein